MDVKDFFAEYKQLIEQMRKSQDKVSKTLDKALTSLDAEKKRYEDFNNKSWLNRYRSLIIAFVPFFLVVALLIGAYLFVGTGHTIHLKIGDLELTAE